VLEFLYKFGMLNVKLLLKFSFFLKIAPDGDKNIL
jgi:hypothetical protein